MLSLNEKYPHISAIVNCHNHPKTPRLLKRALDSIAAQQLNPDLRWEVVVVCDGKPDDAIVEVVKGFSDEDDNFVVASGTRPHLTFFGTDEASGYQCYPKNTAIVHQSKGEYISFLDYDNEWTPQHLQVLYDAMIEGVVWPDFTYGRRKYVVDGECDSTVKLPGGQEVTLAERETPLIEWTNEAVQMLAHGPMYNFVDTSDFMIARGALWRLQVATGRLWNEEMRRFADWELITRGAHFAGLRGKAVDAVVQIYHWHGDNVQLTRAATEEPQKKSVL